jgi:hypothetical protein
MSRVDLESIREWATAKLSGRQELQGAGSQYERLRETLDAILTKMDSAVPQSDNSPCGSPSRKAHLRLEWCKSRDVLLHGQAARLLRLPVERDAP